MKKTMKASVKNLLKAAAFIAGLALLLAAASAVFLPKNNTESDWKHDVPAHAVIAEPANTIDVLFLGDSEVYSSVNPLRIWEKYGYTSYCCSSSKQRLWYTIEFFLMALRTQTPKIVVVETNNVYKFFSAEESMLHGLDLILPIVRFHDRWKCMKPQDLFREPEYTYIENNKGYRLYKESKAASVEGYMDDTDASSYVSFLNRTYLSVIAAGCRSIGARLVLLSTPSTKNWSMKKHNSAVKLAENLGADYIDMNLMPDELNIDWEKDTRDMGDHMNYFGAEKVTAYLGSYLDGTGLLTSHKSDGRFSAWNDALNNFNNEIEAWRRACAPDSRP